MRRKRLILTVIVLGLLTRGSGYAGDPPKSTDGKDSHETQIRNGRPVETTHGNSGPVRPARTSLTKIGITPPKTSQPGPIHTLPKSPPAIQPHQSALTRNAPAATGGPAIKNTVNHGEPVAKLPTSGAISGSSAGNAHNRSATLAAVGGTPAPSSVHATAAIRGGDLKHKP